MLGGVEFISSFLGLLLDDALIVDIVVTGDWLMIAFAVGLVGSIDDCGSASVAGDASLIPGIMDDCERDSVTESQRERDDSFLPNGFAWTVIVLLKDFSVYRFVGANAWV